MSSTCNFTGKKRRTMGRKIIHRGIAKKSGGIGLQLVKRVKRTFKANMQKVRVLLPTGQVKRMSVSTKALKSGKVVKAPRRTQAA